MELNGVVEQLKELKAEKVFVQFPEGLKNEKIQNIAKALEKEGITPILCIESTFGACDVRDAEAKRLQCDTILHVGHISFGVESDIPVVYWEYFLDSNPIPILEKEFDKLNGYEKIGLVGSLQYMNKMPEIKKYLERKGKEVFIAEVEGVKYAGQILGCRLKAGKTIEDKVDAFLCVSAAIFYMQGLFLNVNKPVLSLDLEKKKIYDTVEVKKRLLKIMAWNENAFKEARKVGILTSWKKGQLYIPYSLKNILEEKLKKEVYIIAGDEITPEKIMGLKLDALISTACPRVATDDVAMYDIPIIGVNQVVKFLKS